MYICNLSHALNIPCTVKNNNPDAKNKISQEE